jgi:hypothetical protein
VRRAYVRDLRDEQSWRKRRTSLPPALKATIPLRCAHLNTGQALDWIESLPGFLIRQPSRLLQVAHDSQFFFQAGIASRRGECSSWFLTVQLNYFSNKFLKLIEVGSR